MWVKQTYEFARKDTEKTGIFAGVTLKFERYKNSHFLFLDEWERRTYGISDQVRSLTEQFLNERKISGLKVTLVDFRFSDVHLTDEAIEIAIRGCLTAAIEHFPSDVRDAKKKK